MSGSASLLRLRPLRARGTQAQSVQVHSHGVAIQVQLCGANGEVTGSSHLLRVGERQDLIDCGMVQGD